MGIDFTERACLAGRKMTGNAEQVLPLSCACKRISHRLAENA